jgi:plasmid stability protein
VISTEAFFMASMVIRNIPDDLMARVKEAAKREGKSAEQIAREALAEKVKPSRDAAWASIDALRARTKPIDMDTWQKLWEEARDERDNRPWHPVDDNDR